VTRRWRAVRYGASVALVIVGAACGALISGSLGGTLATVMVGLGLVGIVSLVFYEVGLTEDRDRERRRPPADGTGPGGPGSVPGPAAGSHPASSPRPRPLARLRGERRRLR
jgi:hypothetical protein